MAADGQQCFWLKDAEPYVMGLLTGRRLERYKRHLEHCAECRREVDVLQGAAASVSMLATRHIPLEPVDGESDRRASGSVGAPLRRGGGDGAGHAHAVARGGDGAKADAAAGATAGGHAAGATRVSGSGAHAGLHRPAPARRRWRVTKTPMPKPAVFGILAVAIIAAVTVMLSHKAASVKYVRTGVKAGWSGGGAALKLDGNQLELLVEKMPAPQAGEGYQIWVIPSSTKQPQHTTAWLHPNAKGQAGTDVPGNYHDWEALAVYVEPLKGKHTTVSGAVVVADLRNVS